MSDSQVRSGERGEARAERGASINELLDRAVLAINSGDRAAASALAGQVLAVDEGNTEAEDLLTASPGDRGEIRRLTILFADLVDSTALSTRLEPETYRLLVGGYREKVQRAVDRYGGHIASTKGDGLLAVFGHPVAHEDDVRRAVQAGLDITRDVRALSELALTASGWASMCVWGCIADRCIWTSPRTTSMAWRPMWPRGYLASRRAGSVVVSDGVEPLIGGVFELERRAPAAVKGVDAPITHYRVVGECAAPPRVARTALIGRERELALLSQSWARAQAGTLTVPGVVFGGEPGIGKSRVALAAGEMVHRDGAAVVELFGSPLHAGVGLHPVRTLLERRCGINRLADGGQRLALLRAELAAQGLDPQTAGPLLAPVLGIGPQEGYQPVAAEGAQAAAADLRGSLRLPAGLPRRWPGLGGRRGWAVAGPVHHRGARSAAVHRQRPAAYGLDHTRQRVAAARLAGDGVRSGAADRRTERRAHRGPGRDGDRAAAGADPQPLRRCAVLHRAGGSGAGGGTAWAGGDPGAGARDAV